MLGREEIEVIGPAIEAARAKGMNVEGPHPSDSMLYRVLRDGYDAVIAMYHDQGHILVKTYGFEESYTVTLGLPIIRTSVDHGTAFGKAGKGTADPRSLLEAIKAAVQMARHRRKDS
jgi:4-hydroxythreonine-4-phosphate dehydrogenase